ncbi:MAG: hypothetical protein J5700_02850 [Treponema sp.]|nr:hypothetical protein [Treponema sp.]
MVSFAGGRFAARSAQSLVEGQTFRAQISLQGQSVALKIAGGQGLQAQGGEALVKAFDAMSPEAREFLAALGLPADSVSAKILQAMIQQGAKLDSRLMQKVRRAALKFAGREAEAAEAALALEEKGIDCESAALDQIMDALEGGEADGQPDQDGQEGQNGSQGQESDAAGQNGQESGAADWRQILGEVKRFFCFAENLAQNGALFDGDPSQQKVDALAVFNHLRGGGQGGQKGWVLFPFEYGVANAPKDEQAQGKGTLRLYLDYEKRSLEKMAISFKSVCANLFFVVYLENKKVRKIVVCGAGQESLEGLKNSFGLDVKVEAADFEKVSTFGAEDLPIFGVEGFA